MGEVEALHKALTYPYILHNRLGDKVALLIMVRDRVTFKAIKLTEAVLLVMGLYYACRMPYPTCFRAVMLYVQTEVLGDEMHSKDIETLQRGMKELADLKKILLTPKAFLVAS